MAAVTTAVDVHATPVVVEAAMPDLGEQVLINLGLDPRKSETKALVLLCERYRLDPVLNHAWIISTKSGFKPYVTRDGMIEVAHRSGMLDGIVVDEQRRNSTNDGWTAFVSVWRKDMSHPFRYGAQCKDTEFQAKQGWGIEQAIARAERRALRRAFNIPAYGDDPESGDANVDVVDVVDTETGEERPDQPSRRSTAASAPTSSEAPDSRLSGEDAGDESTGADAPPDDDEPPPSRRLHPDQQTAIAHLMDQLGHRTQAAQLDYAGKKLGREIDPKSGRISYDEGEQLLAALKADVAARRTAY